MSNLFKIVEELDKVFWDIEEAEGVMDENLEARLSIAEEEFAEKLDAYAFYIKSLSGQEAVIKDEIQVMRNRIEANKKKADRLKEALRFAVEKFGEVKPNGKHKFKTAAHSYWTQDSEGVNVDESFSDKDYIKYSIKMNGLDHDKLMTMIDIAEDNESDFYTEPKIDKKAIKEAIKEGKVVEDAELIVKTGIRIR